MGDGPFWLQMADSIDAILGEDSTSSKVDIFVREIGWVIAVTSRTWPNYPDIAMTTLDVKGGIYSQIDVPTAHIIAIRTYVESRALKPDG